MRWTYDATAGALYVYLREGEIDHQVELRPTVVADIDAAGSPVGLEMLSPGTVCRSVDDVEAFRVELVRTLGLSADEARMVTMLCFVNFPRDRGLVMRPPGVEEAQETLDLQFA